jgi:hypothetical protein
MSEGLHPSATVLNPNARIGIQSLTISPETAMKSTFAALIALSLTSPAWAWGECAHTAERQATVDPLDARALLLRTGAGDLEVRGEPGRTRIEARGRACASSAELLEQIQFRSAHAAGAAHVETVLPQTDSSWGWNSEYAWMDVVLLVPAGFDLSLEDSSGDATLRDLGAVAVRDSSGDVEIENVGEVTGNDSSGDFVVIGARGVRIDNDSSGDLRFDRIAGSVRIDSDSSGDIDMREVQGDINIGSDSSGDIDLADVRGSVRVDSDSSGGIDVVGVGGDFVVRSDTSGDISHRGVSGRVDIPEQD